MRLLLQRFAKLFSEIVRALGAYRDLFAAWLDAAASHLFPTPVKVRAGNRRQARPRVGR